MRVLSPSFSCIKTAFLILALRNHDLHAHHPAKRGTPKHSDRLTGAVSHDPYAVLRIPNFRRLVLSHGAATIAREAQIVVIGWQIFERTHDPLSLGLIGLAEAIPFIAAALYAGHIADRAPRKLVAMLGTSGLLLSAIALLLFTIFPALIGTAIWPVYAVIFMSGLARSFTRPALTSLSVSMIPRELYPNGVAWRTSTWQMAAIAGPAAGGMIYGFAGPIAAYATVCALMTIAVVAIAFIDHESRSSQADDLPLGESLKIGIRFLKSEPVVLTAMTLDLFAVLFGGAVALLPAFATILSVGPQGLGAMRAAPAIGSILTGLVLAHRPPLRRTGLAIFTSVALFGLSMILFALSRNFLLSLGILMFSGVADSVSVVIRGTLIQTRTPEHMMGRVSAVSQIFIGSSNEIGAFESGLVARMMGVVPSVIFGGCMTLAVVGIMAWRSPQLRRLRELHTP